jgi:hypothetical protein
VQTKSGSLDLPISSRPVRVLWLNVGLCLCAGGGLRRDVTQQAGVASVAVTREARKQATALLGGAEEQFAFKRAVSRLYEMQSPSYLLAGRVAAL